MVVRFKQLTRQFNSLKTKRRYKEKRERRGYLTEAYLDGELALYKPAYAPYKVFTDKVKWTKPEPIKTEEQSLPFVNIISENPIKLSWFDKLLLFIRRIFKVKKW